MNTKISIDGILKSLDDKLSIKALQTLLKENDRHLALYNLACLNDRERRWLALEMLRQHLTTDTRPKLDDSVQLHINYISYHEIARRQNELNIRSNAFESSARAILVEAHYLSQKVSLFNNHDLVNLLIEGGKNLPKNIGDRTLSTIFCEVLDISNTAFEKWCAKHKGESSVLKHALLANPMHVQIPQNTYILIERALNDLM